jgi:hypothetical protein
MPQRKAAGQSRRPWFSTSELEDPGFTLEGLQRDRLDRIPGWTIHGQFREENDFGRQA